MTAWALAAWLLLAPPAELRVVQALPLDDSVSLALRQGDQVLWDTGPLRGGQFAEYRETPAARLDVVVSAGEQQVTGQVDLAAGGRFTLVLHRLLGEPFLLLPDPALAVEPEQAVVRFVHVVPDHDLLWVQVRRPRGTDWRDADGRLTLNYPGMAAPLRLAPGPLTLRLLAPDEEGGEPISVEDFTGLRLLPGVALTVVICGLDETEGERDLPLTLVPLIDAVAGDGR